MDNPQMVNQIICSHIETINLNKYDVEWDIEYGLRAVASTPMFYRRSEKKIYINISGIMDLYETFDFFPFDDLIFMTIIHELGHHLQWNAEEETLNSLLEEAKSGKECKIKEWRHIAENGAWEYGKSIIPNSLKREFDDFNQINMSQYRSIDEYFDLLSIKRKEYELGDSLKH